MHGDKPTEMLPGWEERCAELEAIDRDFPELGIFRSQEISGEMVDDVDEVEAIVQTFMAQGKARQLGRTADQSFFHPEYGSPKYSPNRGH